MELTHLKYFLEVARTEHVTQSAKTLCIVQPALTHALHKLEEELGVKLFKTQGRNVKLTEIGEYFYKKVKPLYEDIESLPAQLRAMENEQSATVNLNVLAASSFVTNAVILYKRNDPDLRFNLVQNEETTLYDICVRTYANYKAAVRHYSGEDPKDENFVCTENIYLAVPSTESATVSVSRNCRRLILSAFTVPSSCAAFLTSIANVSVSRRTSPSKATMRLP